MNSKRQTEVYWRGIHVGHLVDWMPDMWYLEGRWAPLASDDGTAFTNRVSKLDLETVYADLTKGIRIQIRDESDSEFTDCVAITLTNDNLFLRQIIDSDAVKWANENVPE